MGKGIMVVPDSVFLSLFLLRVEEWSGLHFDYLEGPESPIPAA